MSPVDPRAELLVIVELMQTLLYRLQRALDAVPPQEQERSASTRQHPQDVPF